MFKKLMVLAAMLAVSGAASATSVYDTLTAAVSFTDLQTALLGVIVTCIGFTLVIGGAVQVWRLARRASHRS